MADCKDSLKLMFLNQWNCILHRCACTEPVSINQNPPAWDTKPDGQITHGLSLVDTSHPRATRHDDVLHQALLMQLAG